MNSNARGLRNARTTNRSAGGPRGAAWRLARQPASPVGRPVRDRGFLLLEAAVALVLLAAAATAVATLASSFARQRQAQTQQTAVQMAAENAVERLRVALYADLPQLAEQLSGGGGDPAADAPAAADAAMQMTVQIAPFSVQGIDGQHVTVTVAAGRQASGRPFTAVLELWRFEPPAAEASE